MRADDAVVGRRVRSLVSFVGVPTGTEGVIDADYGTGVMVAWDMPAGKLPAGYREYDGRPMVQTGIVRDGFDKESELEYLELV